jgi:AraC-like DNA-binding protein
MAELTVGAGFARGLFELAVAKGAPSAALADRSGLDPAGLGDLDARVPFDAYVALMRAAKALTGDDALALHFGEAVDIADLSIVALLGQSGTTPLEALPMFNRYSRLAIEVDSAGADRIALVRRGGTLWLVDRRPNPNAFPELTESSFARMVCSGRRHGYNLLEEVHVTHAAPSYRAEYDRIFQVPVVFESEWNALRIDPAMLTMAVGMQPPYVAALVAARADALLAALDRSKSVRGKVEALLEPMLAGGGAGIGAVAAKMGVSRQTLYRKLKAEGTTFEKLLDALRHRLALDQLGAGKRSIGEIAWQLGFSDRAAFSRAFKRWTGTGPGAIRARKQSS